MLRLLHFDYQVQISGFLGAICAEQDSKKGEKGQPEPDICCVSKIYYTNLCIQFTILFIVQSPIYRKFEGK